MTFWSMALWKYLKRNANKDGLPDPRGSLSAEVPSQAIEQANREVRLLMGDQQKGQNGKKRGSYRKYVAILSLCIIK